MHTLIDAMPTIIQHAPHAQAVIVGGRHAQEPEYPKVLTQKIGAAGLHDHVHQVGYQANVALWMQAMDVFVHASDREPFGIVILEAMSLGKPVVATDQGGPTEIIAEEQNGLLAPYEDADVLAERVLRYLRNPGFAARIGRNARQRAQDFSPSTFACRFTDALHSIAGKDVQPEA
jgi:glycosyltransferase involved in cell wall biosynthesis